LNGSWTENPSDKGTPLQIRFTIEVTCGDEEPSRVLKRIDGEIFEFVGDALDEKEVVMGRIRAYLVQVDRSFDEGESLFAAMDSIDQSVYDCYSALFDPKTDEWNSSIIGLYGYKILSMDVLYLESVDVEPECQSLDITPIIRETLATFGANVGLVAHEAQPENAKVWTDFGFRKLADSDFYTYAPELLYQDGNSERVPSASSTWATRVPRGRRRVH